MDQSRPWYRKKRFLIPIGTIGLLTALGIAGNSSPHAIQQSQQATSRIEQTVQTSTNTVPVLQTTAPVETKTEVPKSQPVQNTTAPSLSNDNYYENVDDDSIHSPAYTSDNSVPAGASAQCSDGTYSFSAHRQGTCSHHGGIAAWY